MCWEDTVAVDSHSWEVITFNGITGSQMAILSEYTWDVISLTFSLDGASLVSGSVDHTIILWDIDRKSVV